MKNNGFTLTELTVVVGLISLVAAFLVPRFVSFNRTWHLVAETDKMASTLRAARSAAITKKIPTVFEFNTTANTYSYFEDVDGDNQQDTNEFTSGIKELPSGIRFDSHTLSATNIVFQPRGNCNQSGSIKIVNSAAVTRSLNVFGGTGNISLD